jgi:hypothetical protein
LNCAAEPDDEILAIDALEDSISPHDDQTTRIRNLIKSLELCHHKAERWVELIIEAIGSGSTTKGPGTRTLGQRHPIEKVWQNCCAALTAWCAGSPAETIAIDVGGVSGSKLAGCIGNRSPLKEWQVQRVIEKVREYVVWPRSYEDGSFQYVGMVESGTEYESIKANECPEYYRQHSDFWKLTVQTILRDTVDGKEAEITLADAIDLLEPCHWNFIENLTIVLKAIGGDLHPEKPYAACARNIKLVPIRNRMSLVSRTLRAFCENGEASSDLDTKILRALGKKTPIKRWLAASLDKTIRLQLGLP